ncbi:DUF5615 family PIN-like protein [Anabaena sp. FACHB-709]|uniref:DUF5615 domain-containing protein n=2 Tax=Nostocaceae TaxID=1162 RepID=A0A1Z4KLB5_ANAVA|nr:MULTISPECIES: DUF5615 family PIN-like protein [Nostocaceae]BAY69758.1 hypothetical protein NIES23_25570 [Trichormus variabilis NIES-23]HBW33297.1 hypothetical protein [Nostoc sp. UBA8866]MBD2172872.1 DUF5615 family PIN-like protein [Anabaena cylindrica FACHB-318]MBD2264503.1 DUF5615 family PIN-like protein [Anabaena sp. FACHB-709]MBD2273801.1 DUF5615 family PIN-like protein [Nostoc sp. PCC 7120 = FACHB-418]
MSQICFYLDEDAGKKSLTNGLRNAGIDVMTTAEADRLGSSDDNQLIWATEQKRVIYSFNVGDFCRLHKAYLEQQQEHSGIVLAAEQSYAIGEQLRGLLKLVESLEAENMANQLVFLKKYIDNF